MNYDLAEKKNLIAQWAFDTKSILGRFHIWLEDIEVEWTRGKKQKEFTTSISFLNGRLERQFAVTGAVTALGTRIFGGFGDAKELENEEFNQVKKNADALSAYAMSEGLWFLSRQLPENHVIMVCLGEGLMPKAGETPEMGSNPLLGFGRVYGRPEIAGWVEEKTHQLLNNEEYSWEDFYSDLKNKGITVWGAAIDTLENTSRFARGRETGPMSILHIFDQPMVISKPYEGYFGNIVIPAEVSAEANRESVLINFNTARSQILKAIIRTYPGIQRENIHVWTLTGKSREKRLSSLWTTWENLGVHLVDEEWITPFKKKAFTDSGTYAPTYCVKNWKDEEGKTHVLIIDGYAASAEAIQAASLAKTLNIKSFLSVFTSTFKKSYVIEPEIMRLDPDAKDLKIALEKVTGEFMTLEQVEEYRGMIVEARSAGIPLHKNAVDIEDFLPEKKWEAIAICGFMNDDPYSDFSGVEKISKGVYKVWVRLSSQRGEKKIIFTLRLMEDFDESRLVFSPILNRFLDGEDYSQRPVKISDSGRIRNELQTLCSTALVFYEGDRIFVDFSKISPRVIAPQRKKKLKEILSWYKENHPLWFSWLSIDDHS
jgi:hypothetical protein